MKVFFTHESSKLLVFEIAYNSFSLNCSLLSYCGSLSKFTQVEAEGRRIEVPSSYDVGTWVLTYKYKHVNILIKYYILYYIIIYYYVMLYYVCCITF